MKTQRTDIYSRVTQTIVAQLEQGVRPWMKPWSGEHAAGRVARPLRVNGTPYKGINVLMLWEAAEVHGFAFSRWCTYRQATELGGQVRGGSKGSLVVYADRLSCTEVGEDGEENERDRYFMKGYTVFNIEQVDGLPAHYYDAPASPPLDPVERIAQADAFFANTGAEIRHGGDRAYYAPTPDFVQMPRFEAFRDAESYAATLAHELTHWTKHKTRLNRDFGRKQFGDEGYAREELVAEIGAAFLCSDLAITPEVRDDHAAYLDHWLKVLKEDKRAIFQAAAHAQRAADYLHALQPQAVAA